MDEIKVKNDYKVSSVKLTVLKRKIGTMLNKTGSKANINCVFVGALRTIMMFKLSNLKQTFIQYWVVFIRNN